MTLVGTGVLPLYREAVGVFHSPNQQLNGLKYFYMTVII